MFFEGLRLPKNKLARSLRYALGNTLSQIVEVFNFPLRMKLTPGGLMGMWYRLQAILYTWYEQIQQEALQSAVLHGDESGWRVNGKTHWLGCFATPTLTYYMIDRSRGSQARKKLFIAEFAGTLRRHRNDRFTFLDHPGVPFDNNAGERSIRTVITALSTYLTAGQLPKLPAPKNASDG